MRRRWANLSIQSQVMISIGLGLLFSGLLTLFITRSLIQEYFAAAARSDVQHVTNTVNSVYKEYQDKTVNLLATLSADPILLGAIANGQSEAVSSALKRRSAYLQINGDYNFIRVTAQKINVTVDMGINRYPRVLTQAGQYRNASSQLICVAHDCFLQNAIPIYMDSEIVGHVIGTISLEEVLQNLSRTSGVTLYSRLSPESSVIVKDTVQNHIPVQLDVSDKGLRQIEPFFIQDVSQADTLASKVTFPVAVIGGGVSSVLVMLVLFSLRKPLSQIKRAIESLHTHDANPATRIDLPPDPAAADVDEVCGIIVQHLDTQRRYLEEQQKSWEAGRRLLVAQEMSKQKADSLKRSTLDFESERKHIARELHDFYGQHLVSTKLDASTLKVIGRDDPDVVEIADRILDSVKIMYTGVTDILNRLQPPELESVGLHEAIRSMLQRWMKIRPDIDFEYELDDGLDQIDPAIQATVYRVAQESLTNAMKYSQCSQIKVALKVGDAAGEHCVSFDFSDNGQGFDLASVDQSGNGLRGMRERVTSMNGDFDIVTAPKQGTAIHFRIPC